MKKYSDVEGRDLQTERSNHDTDVKLQPIKAFELIHAERVEDTIPFIYSLKCSNTIRNAVR